MTAADYKGNECHTVYVTPDVGLLFTRSRNGTSHWITMSIIASQTLSINDLREPATWGAIQQWRSLLDEWQGPWLYGGSELLYYRLHIRSQGLAPSRKAWKILGRELDKIAANYLEEYVRDCKLFNANLKSLVTALDALLWEAGESKKGSYHFRRGFRAASDLMIDMGLTSEDAKKWCDEAVEAIENGKKGLWQKSGPMAPRGRAGELVRARVRQFIKRYQPWLKARKQH